jgi:uncharacterized membrane protein YbjE (DUF340 family)
LAIDPILYVSFGAGLLAGRLTSWRGAWLRRATDAAVLVLLFTLGMVIGPSVNTATIAIVLLSLLTAGVLLGLTALFSFVLPQRLPDPNVTEKPDESATHLHGLWFLAAVVVGGIVGHFLLLPAASVLEWELYALLFLVAFDLLLVRRGLAGVWAPLLAAFSAAVGIGLIIAVLGRVALPVAFAIVMGMGFYTLAGPLVTASAGSTLGLFAFLTNFLRENLTMVVAPWAGPKVKGEGLTAMGGATSMDTTLYFITRYGDRAAGPLAVASGLTLTILASLLLPVLLALP